MNGGNPMLSKRLRYTRNARKLSQEALAKKINTTKSTISNYENEYSAPSNDVLKDLANALNTTTDYLLGRSDKPHLAEDEEFQKFIDEAWVAYKNEPESEEERLRMMRKMLDVFKKDK